MKNLTFQNQLLARQYSHKFQFSDFNDIIKKLQCNNILSFSNCPILSDLDNYDAPVSTCKFSNKNSDIVAVANENGIVCIENVKYVQSLKYIQTHRNTVYDIAWMPESTQFVTVSGDNSAKLWDCSESNVSLISTFQGHKKSVRCVSFKPENNAVFATGSRDGSLMIWDARAWKKCAKFSHHLPDQVILSGAGSSPCTNKKKYYGVDSLNSKSVTGLIFQNDNTLISCGSGDRYIRVWDMRKTYSRSVSNPLTKYQLSSPSSGFSYLSMNTLGTKLYANCRDSYIYCFNINSYDPDPVAAFYGHENGSFYVKSSVSSDGLYLMSGSSDENAYIWNTRNAEVSEDPIKPFAVLNSHTAEVTCVEMSPDYLVIVSCSDDGTFRLWNPFSVYKDGKDKVDMASCYDVDEIVTVKTRWKNKRKLKEWDEPDTKIICSSHSKICRFYTANLSSPCICNTKSTFSRGEKRNLDQYSNEEKKAKKRNVSGMVECTPPKQVQSNHLITPVECGTNSAPKMKMSISVNATLKRKLEDTPSFMEEVANKRRNCGRILSPLNSLAKEDENKHVHVTEAVSKGYKKKQTEILKEEHGSPTSNAKIQLGSRCSGLASPTSNLPNYVEDGTSPYIHRCPKVIQKENDWLTKLRKSYQSSKTVPNQKSTTDARTSGADRKKINRSSEQTLHKYFKVSSRTIDKSFSSQDSQKKIILAK